MSRHWTSLGWFDTELDRVVTSEELEAERTGGDKPEDKNAGKTTSRKAPAKKDGDSK